MTPPAGLRPNPQGLGWLNNSGMAQGGIPLDEWSGSKAIRELHKTIKDFNEVSSRQSTVLVRLTWVIAFLSLAMLAGLIVQIWLAFCPPHSQ